MNTAFQIIALIFLWLFQVSLAPHLPFGLENSNIAFAGFLAWVLLSNTREEWLWVFALGLALDIVSSLPFGVFTLSLMILQVIILLASNLLSSEVRWYHIVITAIVGTIIFEAFVVTTTFGLSMIDSLPTLKGYWGLLWRGIPGAIIGNIIFLLILTPIFRRIKDALSSYHRSTKIYSR